MIALNLDTDKRVLSTCVVLPNGTYEGMPQVEVIPKGEITDYKYINNDFVCEPLLKDDTKNIRISELKQYLADTDYVVIKIAEGVATWEDYTELKQQRQEWRDEINQLEQ